MNAVGKTSLFALALTAGISAPGLAQQECDIPEGTPREVAQSLVTLSGAMSDERPDARTRSLRQTVQRLTDDAERIDRANAVGRNFMLGKAMVVWMQEPGIGYDATRGAVGYSSNPEARLDLVATAGQAFDFVLTAMPQCEQELENWRMQPPWVDLVNGAIEQITQRNLDSAEVLIKRSMVLTSRNPFGPNLLAAVAQERGDLVRAVELRRQTIELASRDTSYDELRQESVYNLGALLGSLADQTEDTAQKVAYAREAAQHFNAFATEAPDSPQAVAARAGYAQMLMVAGDTSAVATMYADQIANPHNYSDLQLVQAGVVAARAEKADDAAKLFDAALKVNPFNRDALYNLAASHWALNAFDQMFPILTRLIEVEPNNPENLRLVAYAYQGKQRAAPEGAQRRALTDSIIRYVELAEALPVAVLIDEFSRGTNEFALGGQVENKGEGPATIRLQVQFLDERGNVLVEEEASVGPLAPGAASPFRLRVQQAGIHGWRYKVGG
ncbi:MAG TPA: tetratricopeptide repeat protein [Gemmatimonadaceae bacterium]|nr:tetratricopeptide repeat protein [Gemmatimonadaceae bacterium]